MSVTNFVFRSSYYSGRLPGLLGTFTSFLLLGFLPVAIIFFKGLYFQAMSLESRSAFLVANSFYIACLLVRVTYDIFICWRADQFANDQAMLCQELFLRAEKRAISPSDPKDERKKAGDFVIGSVDEVYKAFSTFIRSLLQSLFCMLSTCMAVSRLGYGKLGLIACAFSIAIISTLSHIQMKIVAKQKEKVDLKKADVRNNLSSQFESPNSNDHDQISNRLYEYNNEKNILIGYDATKNWIYIFIKYSIEACITLVSVLMITKTFPIETNTIGKTVLSVTTFMTLTQVLSSIISDSSAIIRDLGMYSSAVSNYNNMVKQINWLENCSSSDAFTDRFASITKDAYQKINE